MLPFCVVVVVVVVLHVLHGGKAVNGDQLYVCVRVCVCVCVRERCVCVCVCERERVYETFNKGLILSHN